MGIVSSLVNFEVDIFVKLASSVTKKIPLSPPLSKGEFAFGRPESSPL
jgi:hypothetical protein